MSREGAIREPAELLTFVVPAALQSDSERRIGPGLILIATSALVPQSVRLESDSNGVGWTRVAGLSNAEQLEQKLTTAGWTFFFMAGKIRTIAFGFNRQSMIAAALKRLMARVKTQKCNCLEIDAVATRTFLGIPYVSISAHARHIQKEMAFCGQ
jgi:hypothetical protein